MSRKITEITRKDLNIKAKKAGIKIFDEMLGKQLVNAYNKYLKNRKSQNIYKKFSQTTQRNIKKRTNPTKTDLSKAQTLHNKSLSDLQRLARLRRIKNYEDMTKKDLIYTLLRSEDNYMKYINTSTDDELKEKINQIRILLTKLCNTLTNEKKNIIRDELYKKENQERLTKAQKERRLIYLTDLLRHLNNKDKYL